MNLRNKIWILGIASVCFSINIFGQGNIEDLLYTEVDNLNPVYKPVMGLGVGVFNYLGDVRNPGQNPLNGTVGYKVNVATFIDNKQYVRANFYFIGGALSGNERSYSDPMRNLNFRSDILLFGINLNYDFDNFYKTYRKVHPYISVGVETITFNSMIDSFRTVEGVSERYFYWPDGTIRNRGYSTAGIEDPSTRIIQRDYEYETTLRNTDWGQGNYPQYSFAIPFDVGLDFWLSNRVLFRIGTSYHLTFTDNIDHVSAKNTSGVISTNNRNDDFMFTYATLHLDLFSSKKTLAVQRLFAELELDLTLIGDEDNDGYMDGWDHCPGTPFGVLTDSTGCPLDDDFDGVPNYLDDEPASRYGAFVDDRGVEISEDNLIFMLDMSNAVNRRDVPLYLRTPSSYSNYQNISADEIPEKFLKVDSDNDGYISFDEILEEIDKFFDFSSELNSDDIYELNNFFFSQ